MRTARRGLKYLSLMMAVMIACGVSSAVAYATPHPSRDIRMELGYYNPNSAAAAQGRAEMAAETPNCPPDKCGGSTTQHYTIALLKSELPSYVIGPSSYTGYGKATLSNLVETSTHHWYATLHVSFEGATAQQHGYSPNINNFCLPWNFQEISGGGCWNDPRSWNWGKIFPVFGSTNGDGVLMTAVRQRQCFNGAATVSTLVAGGRIMAASQMMQHLGIRVTPQGFVVSLIQGCIVNIFKSW